MYKIVVVGVKQVYASEYYKAFALFYDLLKSTDYTVLLYRTVKNGEDILLCSGETLDDGSKKYKDLTIESVRA